VSEPGQVPFSLISELVDEVRTVSEDSISRALVSLLERAKLLAEPAGAASVAAILDDPKGFTTPTVAIVSGGNIDPLVLLEVIRNGLASAGRFMMFRVRLSDRPGELMRLLTELARMDVNVLNVHHDRASESLGIGEVDVQLQVATRGSEHRSRVRAGLTALGYELS
jgi:threonine dehydratase